MLTLLDCQTDQSLSDCANVAVTSQTFINRINEACKRLLDRGDWWATVVKAQFVVYENEVTWPRWVGTVLAVNECQHPTKMQSVWYDFLPLDSEDWRLIGRYYPNWRNMRGGVTISEMGTAAVFNNIPAGQANFIIVFPRDNTDAGKTMTVWGLDANGWPASETMVMPQNTATPNYVASVNQYQTIQRVQKDVTYDYLDAYNCPSNAPGTLYDLGHYAPGETRGEYRVSLVKPLFPHRTQGVRRISALIKLQHIPAVMPNDLVSIGNPAAIKLMYQAIQKETAADTQGAQLDIAAAVKELNLELQNKLPENQIPVSYEEFNGVNMSRHSAF